MIQLNNFSQKSSELSFMNVWDWFQGKFTRSSDENNPCCCDVDSVVVLEVSGIDSVRSIELTL